MTQDEIIDMARQVGYNSFEALKWEQALTDFAKLVAAKHDPKIAIADAYRAGVDSGIAAEREACAKVCEPQEQHDDPLTAWKIAQAIRARGET